MSEWLIRNKAEEFYIPVFEARKCIEKYGNCKYQSVLFDELRKISNIYNHWISGHAYPRSKDNIGKITLSYLGYDEDMRDALLQKYYYEKNIHDKINTRASYTHIINGVNIRSYYVKEEANDGYRHLFYINE